jgi:hypothetical protein
MAVKYHTKDYCRLDYFNATDYYIISQGNIKPGFKTDHFCVTLYIKLENCNRGQEHLKLNKSILLDNDFKLMLNENINGTEMSIKIQERHQIFFGNLSKEQ